MHNDISDRAEDDPDLCRMRILEAIARRLLLTANYNGQRLTLAPHALFARHGDLFVSAVNLTKSWRADEEKRLGYFNVAGLACVEIAQDTFELLPDSGPLLLQAGGELILAAA
ncbi:hypothetical protein [Tsuneonella sp. HG222]